MDFNNEFDRALTYLVVLAIIGAIALAVAGAWAAHWVITHVSIAWP